MGGRYLPGIDAALRGAALPYGYTVTLWSSGAALLNSHGTPNVGQVFLFAAGAMLAYGALKIASHERSGGDQVDVAASPRVFRAGAFHVAGAGLGIGAAALIAEIPTGVAWPLASFGATLVYLTVTSLEIALLERR